MVKSNTVLYGVLSGAGLLVFYIIVVSLFQNVTFAFLNLRSLWYLIFPLAIGFGTQIGLFLSIRTAGTVVGTTGAVSGGSMLACCSHFLLQIIPLAGLSGVAIFLVKYQSWLLGVGVLSNLFGISFMLKHKRKMKGGHCMHHG